MEQAAGGGGWRKGPWTHQEDKLLIQYVTENGEGRWSSVSKCTGLKRSGKSSRLRWVNYLRPGLKKGHLTPQEEGIIIELHALWGNRWSTIARYLPGRTDNEIKNYWRTHFKPRKAFHAQQKKSKTLNQKLQQQTDHGNNNISESSPQESGVTNSQKEEEIEFPSDENHQFLPAVYQETASDFNIPLDCYLWGGLWNMDDDDQSQANFNNYYHPFEGDHALDFMQSGEFFF